MKQLWKAILEFLSSTPHLAYSPDLARIRFEQIREDLEKIELEIRLETPPNVIHIARLNHTIKSFNKQARELEVAEYEIMGGHK